MLLLTPPPAPCRPSIALESPDETAEPVVTEASQAVPHKDFGSISRGCFLLAVAALPVAVLVGIGGANLPSVLQAMATVIALAMVTISPLLALFGTLTGFLGLFFDRRGPGWAMLGMYLNAILLAGSVWFWVAVAPA